MSEKKRLQEVTDFKVMNVKECLDALGWNYEDCPCEDRVEDITCPCGGELEFRGFFGTEVIECQGCGRKMVDLFSPIPISNSSCTVLNPKDFDTSDNKHWIAIDGQGGIKVEESK